MRRALCATALVLIAALLAACGKGAFDDEGQEAPRAATSGPAGGASNPIPAVPNPSRTRIPPAELVGEGGSRRSPASGSARAAKRADPCLLVSQGRAQAILGTEVRRPLQAPQGPTCIYRASKGKGFITVAVQDLPLAKVLKRTSPRTRVIVAERTGYCAELGRPALYVPLPSGRVLTVSAPCALATQFAEEALQRL